jgi:SulP family sulfate permease
VLLVVVLVASAPVGLIPLAALSGVLMVTAIRMVHVHSARAILRSTRADAAAYLITALITVSVDLIVAVGIGVVVAGVFALRSIGQSARVEREPLSGDPQEGDEHIAVLRVDGSLIFASAERILDEVTGLDRVTVVILRLSQLQDVDATGARVLSEIVTRLEARGVTVLIKGVRDRHAALFRGIGVMQALRHGDHLFTTLDAAVAHARHHIAGSPLRTE